MLLLLHGCFADEPDEGLSHADGADAGALVVAVQRHTAADTEDRCDAVAGEQEVEECGERGDRAFRVGVIYRSNVLEAATEDARPNACELACFLEEGINLLLLQLERNCVSRRRWEGEICRRCVGQ